MKFFLLLVAAWASASNAVTTVPHQCDDPPAIGYNVNGTSVFTNYDNLKTNGQAFMLIETAVNYETPAANVTGALVNWLSAATFSDDSDRPAYASCVLNVYLGSTLQDNIAAGAQIAVLDPKPQLMSSSYSSQGNVLESVTTSTYDDWTVRFWDDGLPINNGISWEGHDAGDTSPNADTSALAARQRLQGSGR